MSLDIDMDKLMRSLDDPQNEYLFKFTTNRLREMNCKMVMELRLGEEETDDILRKLEEYRYVDEMDELKYGSYIRWICLTDPEDLFLNTGAIFCNMKICDNGVYLQCKSLRGRAFQIKMDECMIFQKLTPQEKVLLVALDHLVKKGKK
jgi:hypothetical protein